MTALKANEQASLLGTFVPPGVIMPFGGATAPTGWLACNTATGISTTTYAALFAAIGYAWGNPGGGLFNLPDLRGRFPRGVDGGIARDPDRTRRIACNAGGNTTDNVGSVQGMASAIVADNQGNTKISTGLANAASSISGSVGGSDGTHIHGWQYNANASAFGANNGASSNASGTPTESTLITPSGSGHGHSHSLTAAAQGHTGDLETRPVNANVNYIIKI
jgi:microcystin-dependent protein